MKSIIEKLTQNKIYFSFINKRKIYDLPTKDILYKTSKIMFFLFMNLHNNQIIIFKNEKFVKKAESNSMIDLDDILKLYSDIFNYNKIHIPIFNEFFKKNNTYEEILISHIKYNEQIYYISISNHKAKINSKIVIEKIYNKVG